MSCISNAPTILGVSEGMCSINLGGLQADLKGGLGGGAPPVKQIDILFNPPPLVPRKWFYDAREKETDKARWFTYPNDVCTELENFKLERDHTIAMSGIHLCS